jgi:hypothetical protein
LRPHRARIPRTTKISTRFLDSPLVPSPPFSFVFHWSLLSSFSFSYCPFFSQHRPTTTILLLFSSYPNLLFFFWRETVTHTKSKRFSKVYTILKTYILFSNVYYSQTFDSSLLLTPFASQHQPHSLQKKSFRKKDQRLNFSRCSKKVYI